MNIPCEQIRSDLSLDIAMDQVLPQKRMFEVITETLGTDKCEIIKYKKTKKVIRYKKNDGSYELILPLAVSFMGGQHMICRHRAQLKKWYKDIYEDYKGKSNYNIRILGVYHYEGNVIFIDFEKETYLKRKMNNSAAWVYTNDLYQAMRSGVFTRVDKNRNRIHSIKYTKLLDYINENANSSDYHLFSQFQKFNRTSNLFKGWIGIKDAIREMHSNNWSHWKQTEWFGWYLEYLFDKYVTENNIESIVKYTGSAHKGKKKVSNGEFDFDLWFDQDKFYGDLKSSDIEKKDSPGNDQITFIECINMFDRFWYVIYEAECLKTEEAKKMRYEILEELGEKKKNDDNVINKTKKSRLLKERVNFVKMSIIELNRINYREALTDFNQGKQPSGATRKPKFNIKKNHIDNFIVFSETIEDILNT